MRDFLFCSPEKANTPQPLIPLVEFDSIKVRNEDLREQGDRLRTTRNKIKELNCELKWLDGAIVKKKTGKI